MKAAMTRSEARDAYSAVKKLIDDKRAVVVVSTAQQDDAHRHIAPYDEGLGNLLAIGQTMAALYESEYLNTLAQKLVALGDMVTSHNQREILSECLLLLDQHMQQDKLQPEQKMLIDTPVKYEVNRGDY